MVREKGFSLIELLIVVAVILVIAAIAIPNLLRSRIAANEASAVAAVRILTTAENAYTQAYPLTGYTCTLGNLGPPPAGQPPSSTSADLIDSALASGQKAGYSFSITNCLGTPKWSYNSAAVPIGFGTTGSRAFCSDASGILWFSADGVAATCQASGTVLQ